jgi:hypothetical protein
VIARRLILATLGSLMVATLTTSVSRATVEVEHYRSLGAMARAADAVVLGRIVSAEPGRIFAGCGYTAATLEVERVLARRVAVPRPTLTIEYFSYCAALPKLGGEIPAERGIFFLRNKGVDIAGENAAATAQEIEVESQYWRRVITAGTIVERDGVAHLPSTYNAAFLQRLEGRPFNDVLREVRRYGALPPTSMRPDAPASAGIAPAVLLAVAIAVFAATLGTGRWRRRRGSNTTPRRFVGSRSFRSMMRRV